MYAVYRHWGEVGCSGRDLLFVTASKQVAEDAVALAALENEEHFDIYMQYHKGEIPHNECIELQRAALTIDPLGFGNDISYEYEEVEVR
jgi:hypothetical protein